MAKFGPVLDQIKTFRGSRIPKKIIESTLVFCAKKKPEILTYLCVKVKIEKKQIFMVIDWFDTINT